MFTPQFTHTSRLEENLRRIAELIAELQDHKLSKLALVDFERQAREISAYSSTSIEGNPLPLTEVKRILKNKPEHIRDSEREVLNYNAALKKLNTLGTSENSELTLPLLLKIQKMVTKELLEKHQSGKIRQEPVFVNDPKTGRPIYLPPDHSDVPNLLEDLFHYLECHRKKMSPLLLTGIFHKQFVLIHPFVDGNGRTARLATKVLLAHLQINLFNLFSFENYYNRNVSKYFQFVGERGNYYDLKNKIDFTSWLEYFTDGIVDELLRVQKNIGK